MLPIFPVINLLRYTAKCHFMPHLLMAKKIVENDPGSTNESRSYPKANLI